MKNKVMEYADTAWHIIKKGIGLLKQPKNWLLIAMWLPLPKILATILGLIAAIIVIKGIIRILKTGTWSIYSAAVLFTSILKVVFKIFGFGYIGMFIGIFIAIYYSTAIMAITATAVDIMENVRFDNQLTADSNYVIK